MEWISVKDRMPDTCEGVLVCGKGSLGEMVIQIAEVFCGDKKWQWIACDGDEIIAPYSDMTCMLKLNDVTHWMPLPETPKDNL